VAGHELPIVRAAGGEVIYADASEPHLPLSRWSVDGPLNWLMGKPHLRHEAFSLRGWLEAWLDRPI
jgi:hypothetical protein